MVLPLLALPGATSDYDIVVQTMFTFYRLLMHTDTSDVVVYGTGTVSTCNSNAVLVRVLHANHRFGLTAVCEQISSASHVRRWAVAKGRQPESRTPA